MRSIFKIVVFSGVAAAAIIACNKQGSSSSTKSGLTLSKSTVARGEQLVVSTQPSSATAIVRFKVFPTTGTSVFSGKDQATAIFASAGNYKVTANYYSDSTGAPYDSSSSPVTVSDSIYNPAPPIQSDTSALAGDAIQIQPITASDTGGLILVAQTSKSYDCYPQLNYYFSKIGNTIEITFLDVAAQPGACGGVSNTAKAYIFGEAPANGVYNFNVILNTATYHGTLTVTDQTYTFDWPFSSAVTISPKVINTK
jgi:hypothetical protein